MNPRTTKSQILFISHGGGPLPLLGDPAHQEMVNNLKFLASQKLTKPTAILVISAHWEQQIPTITGATNPGLIYDYYGFPEASYAIQYPCMGQPELAAGVHKALTMAGIDCTIDSQRGFDHGVFVPLKIMYPDADIPCVQLSLRHDLDAAAHIRIGEALAALNHDGLLILGSGGSFHNLEAYFKGSDESSNKKNAAFEAWLIDTCANKHLNESERADRLIHWRDAPFGEYCHPREEHLLPLHVCYGAAGGACQAYFEINFFDKKSSVYLW